MLAAFDIQRMDLRGSCEWIGDYCYKVGFASHSNEAFYSLKEGSYMMVILFSLVWFINTSWGNLAVIQNTRQFNKKLFDNVPPYIQKQINK